MKRALFTGLAAVVAIVAVQYFFGWNEIFAAAEDFARRTASPWAFLLVIGVGCAFGFSLSLAYLYAGMAFGVWEGWGLCVVGLFISCTIGFFLGRAFVGADFVARTLSKFNIKSDKKIYLVNFYVRAIPGIPYWTQNVILGALRTHFPLYLGVNLAVQGLIGLAMTSLGASVSGDMKYVVIPVLVCAIYAAHRAMLWLVNRAEKSNDNSGAENSCADDYVARNSVAETTAQSSAEINAKFKKSCENTQKTL